MCHVSQASLLHHARHGRVALARVVLTPVKSSASRHTQAIRDRQGLCRHANLDTLGAWFTVDSRRHRLARDDARRLHLANRRHSCSTDLTRAQLIGRLVASRAAASIRIRVALAKGVARIVLRVPELAAVFELGDRAGVVSVDGLLADGRLHAGAAEAGYRVGRRPGELLSLVEVGVDAGGRLRDGIADVVAGAGVLAAATTAPDAAACEDGDDNEEEDAASCAANDGDELGVGDAALDGRCGGYGGWVAGGGSGGGCRG